MRKFTAKCNNCGWVGSKYRVLFCIDKYHRCPECGSHKIVISEKPKFTKCEKKSSK